jgi:ligand-binding sensor domain-containing protein
MYHASDNVFWIQYENGIFDLFDPRSFSTRHAFSLPEVNSLLNKTKVGAYLPFADSKGRYFSTAYLRGIFMLDAKTEKIIHLNRANHPLYNDSIISTRIDNKNRIWLLHGKGLEVSDTSWTKFRFIPFPESMSFKFNDDSLYSVAILPDERVMIGIGSKIIIYEERVNRFTEIHTTGSGSTKAGHIRNILVSGKGQIYFEKQGGIYRLEKDYYETLLWKNLLQPGPTLHFHCFWTDPVIFGMVPMLPVSGN